MNLLDAESYPKSGTWLGSALRWPLRLIPPRTEVRILRGPLRGQRWIVGSGIHRIWLGSYEAAKLMTAAAHATPGTLVLDIGANVGVYTLLLGGAVGPSGRVIAIEPSPRNLDYLRKHLAMNGRDNVTVVDAAVSDQSGSVTFSPELDSSTGRIDANGALVVRAVTVDELVTAAARPVSLMKIDVEGGELNVLKGARETLRRDRPVVLLATHSVALRRDCASFLEALDFDVRPIEGSADPDEWIAQPRAGRPSQTP